MNKKAAAPVLWVTSMFLCLAICFDLAGLVAPDKSFSETENRMLAQFPKITAAGLADGSFGEDTESYLSDQFAYRDVWASLSFFVKHSLFGQREMDGVYIGDDGYLIMKPSAYDQDALNTKLNAVNAVAGKYEAVRQYMAVIPNAVTVLRDKMPPYAPVSEQPGQLDQIASSLKGVTFCDVTDAFEQHRNEELFYHTDHHWTTYGAYLAFCEIAPLLEIDPESFRYRVHRISERFEGTLASKSGSHQYKDVMEIYVPKTETPLSVVYSDKDDMRGTLYEREYLDTKDQYAVFLGGNHPTVDIRTTAQTGRTLLLVKDSYANCFVPFLTPYFDRIVVVDPRYCYDTVDMMIKENDVTDLLYLYNADTFMSDTSLTDFLEIQDE